MKIEILQTVVDSFIDFAGVERKFVVAAVATKEGPLFKKFGIGFSICNPADDFNEEIGTQIAVNKALHKDNKLVSYVNCNAFITPLVVNELIKQEIAYFKAKPSSHIAGYNTMKAKHEQNVNKFNKVQNMVNNHGQVIQEILKFSDEEKQLLAEMLNEN
jgi:hypothetical protein